MSTPEPTPADDLAAEFRVLVGLALRFVRQIRLARLGYYLR